MADIAGLAGRLPPDWLVDFTGLRTRTQSDFTSTLQERRRYYYTKIMHQLAVSDIQACQLTEQWLATGEHESPEFWRNEERLLIDAARQRDFRLFSLTPHERHLLMWSHYGDSHKGICLGFRIAGGFDKALRVSYVREYPRPNFLFRSSRFEQMKAMLLTKSSHWQYEEEYRLYRIRGKGGKNPTHSNFEPDLLDTVILGCEAPSNDVDRIRDILEKRTVTTHLLKAIRAPDKYDLVVSPAS